MKHLKHLTKYSTYITLALFLTIPSFAEITSSSDITVGGSARVRLESKNNTDFLDSTSDSASFTGSRFRVHFLARPTDKTEVFFEPQFTKTWGLADSTNAATPTQSTSGTLYDTGLDVHQAYVNYGTKDKYKVTLGRTEMIYGDHLLVGSVGWSNVARAFDVAKIRASIPKGWVDIFSSKITETNNKASSAGDKNFNGVYVNYNGIPMVKDFDLYYLQLTDWTVTPDTEVTATGVRLKSKLGPIDYRLEFTSESVVNVSEDQMDAELGYSLNDSMKTRFSVEYFKASKGFNQFFPTAHKWLGYADLFSRKNISGFRVGASSNICPETTLKLDFHTFTRTDTAVGAYKFDAKNIYGIIGTSDDIGSEIDFTVKQKLDENSSLTLVYSNVSAGKYLKDQGAKDAATYYALQFATKF